MRRPDPFLLLLCLASACAGAGPRPSVTELHGPRLTNPLPRPGLMLAHLDGSPFDFRKETAGTLTFLFFGYTNCPDVCPLHMANLAGILHSLPPEVQRQVRVVFVTTDPERDTPDSLRAWLARFDSSFVGATGTPAQLDVAQRALGLPPARREGELDRGGYGVTHAAQLWAITPDDSIHTMYPWGMSRDDLAADIPKLLRIWPAR